MATVKKAKKARAKAVSKSKKKSAPLVKVVAKAHGLKARRMPETLRLTSFRPSLTVNNLARSLAFYTGALGFVVGEQWKDGDVVLGAMLKAGACELAISQDDWKLGRDRKKGAGVRIWCDTAQDIDAIAARLKAAGHPLTEEPEDHPAWGMRSLSFDDPDGFHFSIARKL